MPQLHPTVAGCCGTLLRHPAAAHDVHPPRGTQVHTPKLYEVGRETHVLPTENKDQVRVRVRAIERAALEA